MIIVMKYIIQVVIQNLAAFQQLNPCPCHALQQVLNSLSSSPLATGFESRALCNHVCITSTVYDAHPIEQSISHNAV